MHRRALPLLAALALAVSAPAQVTFSFTYADVTANNNMGFDDPTLGATRQSALQSAASMLSSFFTGYSARTVTIDVELSYSDNGIATLASAGSSVFVVDNSFQRNLVMQLIQDNNDNGFSSLGSMSWNFGHDYDYDDSVDGGLFDFKSIALHELTHALGFASFIDETGNGVGSGTTWTFFDQFLTDVNGNPLVSGGGVYQGGTILTDGISGDVYFSGANAMAANGGQRVRIYSPATFEGGSSLSHLNTDEFPSNSFIMPPSLAAGPGVRTFGAVELGILADLGYNVTAVPEPSTYAIFVGLAALGYLTYRRRAA